MTKTIVKAITESASLGVFILFSSGSTYDCVQVLSVGGRGGVGVEEGRGGEGERERRGRGRGGGEGGWFEKGLPCIQAFRLRGQAGKCVRFVNFHESLVRNF